MIYRNVPLIERSFFQRLFRQQPIENAIREVNNLLANYPIENVSRDDIEMIEKKYRVSLCEQFPLNLEEFLAVYINEYSKHHLVDKIPDSFHHLHGILGLSDHSKKLILSKLGPDIYRRACNWTLRDGTITRKEIDYLALVRENFFLVQKMLN